LILFAVLLSSALDQLLSFFALFTFSMLCAVD